MFLNRHQAQGCVFPPGTLLEVWSVRFNVYHRGIAGRCVWNGSQEILHARKSQGVQRSNMIEFAEGQVIRVLRVPRSAEEQFVILSRAYSQIGHPYHLLIANCEHFANWAATGMPHSEQLAQAGTITFTTICLAAVIFARQNRE